MFASEMKLNMRDLCIPLEEYAYQQEFSCALLIGLLDPLLKKYQITLSDSKDAVNEEVAAANSLEGLTVSEEKAAPSDEKELANSAADDAKNVPPKSNATAEKLDTQATDGHSEQLYGEVITSMVQALWKEYKNDSDAKVKAKIEEKQRQVTARVEAVQGLRTRAIEAIINTYAIAGIVHIETYFKHCCVAHRSSQKGSGGINAKG